MTNKEIAISFWNALFTEHDVLKASTFIADNYKQHNPKVQDLKEGFIKHFSALFDNPKYDGLYTKTKQVIEEDGKVVLHYLANYRNSGHYGRAHIDIFKIEDGKIVEHWDVVQNIPAPEDFVHSNTMF